MKPRNRFLSAHRIGPTGATVFRNALAKLGPARGNRQPGHQLRTTFAPQPVHHIPEALTIMSSGLPRLDAGRAVTPPAQARRTAVIVPERVHFGSGEFELNRAYFAPSGFNTTPWAFSLNPWRVSPTFPNPTGGLGLRTGMALFPNWRFVARARRSPRVNKTAWAFSGPEYRDAKRGLITSQSSR